MHWGASANAGAAVVRHRVHHLLRERGGHGAVRLWPHVPLLRLRPQAEEDEQRMLSHLQARHQRHHQDLPEHVGGRRVGGAVARRCERPLLELGFDP